MGLPDEEETTPLKFELNGDRIQILVVQRIYEAYIRFQQTSSIAMSMLVMPALIYTIEELRASYDSFSNCRWFMKMKQFYKAQGLDFRSDVIDSEKNAVEIAQEMLKSPIGRAYRNLMEEGV